MYCIDTKPYYCHGKNDIKVGFVFSYPSTKSEKEGKPLYGQFSVSFNHLLCKLNKNYPELFPYTNWKYYRITNTYTKTIISNQQVISDLTLIGNDKNLKRIEEELTDLDTVICFGEKANFVVSKTIKKFNLNLKTIKVDNINPTPVSRSIKRLEKQDLPRVRTDFKILNIYNSINNQLK